VEHASVAADPGTAMAITEEEEEAVVEAVVPMSFGIFVALNGAVEIVKMSMHAAMRRIVACRSSRRPRASKFYLD
jgi:hypothetical protein